MARASTFLSQSNTPINADRLSVGNMNSIPHFLSERQNRIQQGIKVYKSLQFKKFSILASCAEEQNGCVNRIVWNDDGTLLASCSDDLSFSIWNSNWRLHNCFATSHTKSIVGLRFIPNRDSRFLVTGALDGVVEHHILSDDLKCKLEASSLYCHVNRVRYIETETLDPNIFFSAGEDGCIRQYDYRQPRFGCGSLSSASNATLSGSDYKSPNCIVSGNAATKFFSIRLNPLDMNQFVVTSNSVFVDLYDRRTLALTIPQTTSSLLARPFQSFSPAHLSRGSAEHSHNSFALRSASTDIAYSTYAEFSPCGRSVLATYHTDHIYTFKVIADLKKQRGKERGGASDAKLVSSSRPAVTSWRSQYCCCPSQSKYNALVTEDHEYFSSPRRLGVLQCGAEAAMNLGIEVADAGLVTLGVGLLSRAEEIVHVSESAAESARMLAQSTQRLPQNSSCVMMPRITQISSNITVIHSRILYQRASIYLNRRFKGDDDAGLKDIEFALSLNPENLHCKIKRAMFLLRLRRPEDSLTELHDARERLSQLKEIGNREHSQSHLKTDADHSQGRFTNRRHGRLEEIIGALSSTANEQILLAYERGSRVREREQQQDRGGTENCSQDGIKNEFVHEAYKRAKSRSSDENVDDMINAGKSVSLPSERVTHRRTCTAAAFTDHTPRDTDDRRVEASLSLVLRSHLYRSGETGSPARCGESESYHLTSTLTDKGSSSLRSHSSESGSDGGTINSSSSNDTNTGSDFLCQRAQPQLAKEWMVLLPADRQREIIHIFKATQSTSSLYSSSSSSSENWRKCNGDLVTHYTTEYTQRYIGASNVATDIKEVAFFGTDGEFVVGGSDDGHLFVWDRHTGEIVLVRLGDSEVLNCIKVHPFLPIFATAGLDAVIRVWGPRSLKRDTATGSADIFRRFSHRLILPRERREILREQRSDNGGEEGGSVGTGSASGSGFSSTQGGLSVEGEDSGSGSENEGGDAYTSDLSISDETLATGAHAMIPDHNQNGNEREGRGHQEGASVNDNVSSDEDVHEVFEVRERGLYDRQQNDSRSSSRSSVTYLSSSLSHRAGSSSAEASSSSMGHTSSEGAAVVLEEEATDAAVAAVAAGAGAAAHAARDQERTVLNRLGQSQRIAISRALADGDCSLTYKETVVVEQMVLANQRLMQYGPVPLLYHQLVNNLVWDEEDDT